MSYSANYKHITQNGTYVIVPGSGGNNVSFNSLFVNQAGTGGNLITVAEANGNVIGVRDGTTIHKFDPCISNLDGLVVTVSTGSAGDITVFWD